MSKVIVRLMGGLGNQMFQYATGHALAAQQRVPLLLDRSFLDSRPADMNWTPRTFELDVFRAPFAFADPQQVARMRRTLDVPFHRKLKQLLPYLYGDHFFVEHGTGLDTALFDVPPPVYLEGFWQNEGYFRSVAAALRSELFVPREQVAGLNATLLQAILSSHSASIHVRRGDYVSNPASNAFHGECTVEYYQQAAELLMRKHGIEHFFLFSDEPEWVKDNLHLPYTTTIVSHNTGRESHWDLFLMKHCRHHIIANSSFSWWGAWLNGSEQKTVIAPKTWFRDQERSAADILPSTWLQR